MVPEVQVAPMSDVDREAQAEVELLAAIQWRLDHYGPRDAAPQQFSRFESEAHAAFDAILASDWLAQVKATARAEGLREAAGLLRNQGAVRFDVHGASDARGAALWDAGCFIDPDDGAFGVTTRDGDA